MKNQPGLVDSPKASAFFMGKLGWRTQWDLLLQPHLTESNQACGCSEDVTLLQEALLQGAYNTKVGSTRPAPPEHRQVQEGTVNCSCCTGVHVTLTGQPTLLRILIELSQWSINHSSIKKQPEKGWRGRQEVKVLGMVIPLWAEAGWGDKRKINPPCKFQKSQPHCAWQQRPSNWT